MHFWSHRLIVLLLLFLQGFTPLVHAHVSSTAFNADNGIHIDGLNFAVSGQSQLSDYDQVGYYSLAIGVNSAIQQKQNAEERIQCFCFLLTRDFALPFHKYLEKLVDFSPPVVSFYSFSPSDSSPRAPPFLIAH